MTIDIESMTVRYTGNGVTTVFPFGFVVHDEADLEVYEVLGSTSTLVSPANYSVAGVPGTGTVTYAPGGVPLPGSKGLVIRRIVPLLQELDIQNMGGFHPDSLEDQLDELEMQIQQIAEATGRAVKVGVEDAEGPELPGYSEGYALGWGPDPDELVNLFSWEEVKALAERAAAWVGDNPPPVPKQGHLWFESDSGNTFVWYDDPDGGQWVQINVAQSGTEAELGGLDELYNTRNSAVISFIDPTLDFVRTAGYAAVGDGGGALYKRGAPGTLGGFQSADGANWELTDAVVNPFMFGAKGDGTTDDTTAIQEAFDTLRQVFMAKPLVTYKVSTLTLRQGQTLYGHSQFGNPLGTTGGPFTLTGNGTDPVLKIGDGDGDPRQITVLDLSITNSGVGGCIVADTAPNLILQRCRLRATSGGHALNMKVSYRASIRDCFINATGGGDAIKALNNMNGMVIDHCTVSGGSTGRAMQIGQSQGIAITNNIVESSLHGIWIGADSESGNGNCNGVMVTGNYIEQCSTPFMIGVQFSVSGLQCSGNYISNSLTTVIAARTAAIQFGRIRGGYISDNAFYILNSVEDVFWIWLQDASGGYDKLTVDRNYVQNTPANVYVLKGTYAANGSVKQQVGGLCNFGFMGSGNPIGTDHIQEWVSPLIDAAVSIGPLAWLEDSRISMGGTIRSIDLIDYNGGVLTNVQMTIGRTAIATENVNIANLATLTFTQGIAPVTLATSIILDGSDRIYRIITAGGATGKFRIRIRYRAN